EGELDLVVHFEGALSLPDQTEISVVDQDHHERHTMLRRDGQFLDQELEGVVANDADDLFARIGELRASAGPALPAGRAGLAADDVIARPVNPLELAGGDLVEADRSDELRVTVESGVDLLEDSLRLDGHVVEVGPAKHRALAFGDLCDPGIETAELAAERTFTRRCDQRLQRVF